MSYIGNHTNISVTLDNAEIEQFQDWENTSLNVGFSEDTGTASINTGTFIWKGKAFQIIDDWINNGLINGVGITEGIPFSISIFNKKNNIVAFKGYVDLSKAEKISHDLIYEAPIKEISSDNTLDDQLNGLTMAVLKLNNRFNYDDFADIRYVVQKPVDPISIVIMGLTLYTITKTIIDNTRTISDNIADIAGILAAGLTGSVGSAIKAAATVIATAAFTVALTKAALDLINNILESIYPKTRVNNTVNYHSLLRAIAEELGYEIEFAFEFPKENLFYMPSNRNFDIQNSNGFVTKQGSIELGLPKQGEFGYKASDIVSAFQNMFNCKKRIINGKIRFYDSFADISNNVTSSYVINPVNNQFKEKTNSDEIVKNYEILFQYDNSDSFTIDDDQDISYGVSTLPVKTNNKTMVNISGSEERIIPLSLASRKGSLGAVESVINSFLREAKSLLKILSAGTIDFTVDQGRESFLVMSDNNNINPKIIYADKDGSGFLSIPSNHRDLFSAKSLYNTYHKNRSFASPFLAQELIISGVIVKFGIEDFIMMFESNKSKTSDDIDAFIESVNWIPAKGQATINYRVKKPYTINLKDVPFDEI